MLGKESGQGTGPKGKLNLHSSVVVLTNWWVQDDSAAAEPHQDGLERSSYPNCGSRLASVLVLCGIVSSTRS